MLDLSPESIFIRVIPALIGLVVHEYMHAYTALRCGDPTARNMGRLTFNPKAHLDPIGTILIVLVGFGWAKPVPINPYNFRHPGRDDMLVSFAGPASNFVLGILFALLLRTLLLLPIDFSGRYAGGLLDMVYWGAMINFLLGIFNLLPIAPLDGHHILRELLPYEARERYMQLNRFGPLIIIALFIFGGGIFRLMLVPAQVLIGLIAGVGT
ncbi:MAG: site-2 protease family protein [Anaerolineaceae bacterium]|nr:site-2 protease family protein [Anaerolineaceae bacterium]